MLCVFKGSCHLEIHTEIDMMSEVCFKIIKCDVDRVWWGLEYNKIKLCIDKYWSYVMDK